MDVHIIGGGIGGLAAAVGLLDDKIEITLHEAASELRPVGAGISLGANAVAALDKLGLAVDVRRRGAEISHLRIVDHRNHALRRVDLSADVEGTCYPAVYMHRADLQEILLKAIPSEMLRLGDACKKVDAGSLETGSPSADSATIRFAEGQSIDADLVIGADGIESTVRQSLLDIDPRRETGTVTYRGVVEQQSPLTGQTLQVWGQGTRVGIAPLGDGRSYWFATSNTHLAAPEHPVRLLSRLQDRYQDYPSPIPELIKGTTPDALIITELADIGPLPRWHAGRTVLLGDAAHAPLPYLGQGAGQALEDAVALTRRLTGRRSNGSESAGSTQEGSARPCLETDSSPLESYERARKSRAEWITRLSRLWWRLAQLDGSLARTRNLLVRYGPESIAKLQQNRVARARF